MRISVWPVARPVIREMEMHIVSNIAEPFSDFFPFKKAPKPYLVSENRRYCRARGDGRGARGEGRGARGEGRGARARGEGRGAMGEGEGEGRGAMGEGRGRGARGEGRGARARARARGEGRGRGRGRGARGDGRGGGARARGDGRGARERARARGDGRGARGEGRGRGRGRGRGLAVPAHVHSSWGLMGHVSVTISYSFRCLTTETVKYINENCFIENLAASKYSMWHREGNKCNNKYYMSILHVQKKWAALCAKM